MRLASDYVHPTPHKGRCRVRIYEPDDEHDPLVVVLTEPRDNPAPSVTNAAEEIAAAVVAANIQVKEETL